MRRRGTRPLRNDFIEWRCLDCCRSEFRFGGKFSRGEPDGEVEFRDMLVDFAIPVSRQSVRFLTRLSATGQRT